MGKPKLSAIAILACLVMGSPVWSQSALTLPTDPANEKKLEGVKDYLQREAWAEAARLLQSLLDGPDAFVPVRGAETEIARWTTLHAETHRLLESLPAAGRESYEQTQGPRARELLLQANHPGDAQLLADVSRRYLHTKAGAEATRLLGVHHLDRGRHALAALSFERLFGLPDAQKLPPSTLFPAALAFQRAGDKARADQTWKQLRTTAPGGARLGDKLVSLAEMQASLGKNRPAAREIKEGAEWPFFRGDAARSAWSAAGDFASEPRWRHETAHETATRAWVQEAIKQQEVRGEPVLPNFFPIVAGGKVVYRSYRGIHAVDLVTGKRLWEFESEGGLDTLGQELKYFPYVESWVNAHLLHNPHALFGNSVVGTLTTDGERVYAVEDLAIPPYQNSYHYRGRPVAALEYSFTPGLTEAAHHSRLVALDLKSGKLVWERGGPGTLKRKDDLYPAYFLGPPLPVGGKLYGTIEKDQMQQLICLNPATGELLWTKTLGLAPTRLLADPARRLQAVHLAHAEGILICPTNAGFLFAVDLVSRSFLWACSYREPLPSPEPEMPQNGRWPGRGRGAPTPGAPSVLRPSWATSAPIIHEGQVIFTAPDDRSVHCLNLRDGTYRWKVKPAEGDLDLAGVSRGKVLLVGKLGCRALRLSDGKMVWETLTGVPSGLGILGDGVYYLPLKAAGQDRRPAVYAIHLDTGRIESPLHSPRDEACGNLIFHQDTIFSQTATTITAYPLSGVRK